MSRNCKSLVKESARRIWDKSVAQEGREEVNGAQEGRVEEVDFCEKLTRFDNFLRDDAPNRLMMRKCIIEVSKKWSINKLKSYIIKLNFLVKKFQFKGGIVGN